MDTTTDTSGPEAAPRTEDDIILDKVKAFVAGLAEFHTVNVRMFVTGTWNGVSRGTNWGSGDFHSTAGYIRDWMIEQDERVKITTRQSLESDDNG